MIYPSPRQRADQHAREALADAMARYGHPGLHARFTHGGEDRRILHLWTYEGGIRHYAKGWISLRHATVAAADITHFVRTQAHHLQGPQ